MRATRLKTAAAVAIMGVMLSACGTASPGMALRVGEVEFSNVRVDDMAANICTSLADQLESQGTTVPMGVVRRYVVQGLAVRTQAEQMAAEYDVTPSAAYETSVAQLRAGAEELPEEVREDYIEINSTNALANDVVQQIGQIILEDQGVAEVTPEQASQAGIDAFTTWPDANGVDVDPRYGLKKVDGQLAAVDTNLSVAVSKTATSGMNPEPDAAFVTALPAQHRCG